MSADIITGNTEYRVTGAIRGDGHHPHANGVDVRAVIPAVVRMAAEYDVVFHVEHGEHSPPSLGTTVPENAVRLVVAGAPIGSGFLGNGTWWPWRDDDRRNLRLLSTWGVGSQTSSTYELVTVNSDGVNTVVFQVIPEARTLLIPAAFPMDEYEECSDLDSEHWRGFLYAFHEAMDLLTNTSAEQIAERNAERLIETLIENSSSARRNVAEEVHSALSTVRLYEQRLESAKLQLEAKRRELLALDEAGIDREEIESRASTELSAISEHPDIVGFRVTGDGLEVLTKELPMRVIDDHPDGPMEGIAGEFRLRFDFRGRQVRIYNTTRRIGQYDHPHVNDHQFCLGDQRSLVDGLMRRHDYSAAVSVIVDLLKQVNPEDTYDRSLWRAWFETDNNEGDN